MKYAAFILLLFVPLFAEAANTPPPGSNGDLIYNKNGQYGAACVGTGLSLTTTGGQTCLNSSSAPPSGDFIITETGDPIVTETGDNIVTETSP